MRGLFRFFAGALLATGLLTGCCANNTCDCNDSRADAIYLRFNIGPDSLTGKDFGRSEVDTLYMLRYLPPLDSATSYDSVALLPTATRRPGDTLILNNNAPFALATNRKLNSFEYQLMVRDRNRQLRRYTVGNIKLNGRFEGDGCCTCYVNAGKTLTVNGEPHNATETGQGPVIIRLTK